MKENKELQFFKYSVMQIHTIQICVVQGLAVGFFCVNLILKSSSKLIVPYVVIVKTKDLQVNMIFAIHMDTKVVYQNIRCLRSVGGEIGILTRSSEFFFFDFTSKKVPKILFIEKFMSKNDFGFF